MVRLIMELVANYSFTLTTANGKRNRLPHLKIGVLQGSGLAPLLFNIDTSYILTGIQPAKFCRKGATLSLERWVIEYGHLLHLALMFTECKSTASQIEKLICPRHITTDHFI